MGVWLHDNCVKMGQRRRASRQLVAGKVVEAARDDIAPAVLCRRAENDVRVICRAE